MPMSGRGVARTICASITKLWVTVAAVLAVLAVLAATWRRCGGWSLAFAALASLVVGAAEPREL